MVIYVQKSWKMKARPSENGKFKNKRYYYFSNVKIAKHIDKMYSNSFSKSAHLNIAVIQ